MSTTAPTPTGRDDIDRGPALPRTEGQCPDRAAAMAPAAGPVSVTIRSSSRVIATVVHESVEPKWPRRRRGRWPCMSEPSHLDGSAPQRPKARTTRRLATFEPSQASIHRRSWLVGASLISVRCVARTSMTRILCRRRVWFRCSGWPSGAGCRGWATCI